MCVPSSNTAEAWCRCRLIVSTLPTLVAFLHGPDQPGIVAKTSGWIFARQGNILHADQHRDMEAGEFFQRIEWVPAGADPAKEAAELRAFAASLVADSIACIGVIP